MLERAEKARLRRARSFRRHFWSAAPAYYGNSFAARGKSLTYRVLFPVTIELGELYWFLEYKLRAETRESVYIITMVSRTPPFLSLSLIVFNCAFGHSPFRFRLDFLGRGVV